MSVYLHSRTLSGKPAAIIAQIPCLQDNYGFLIHDLASGKTAAIDTPDADAINKVLIEQNWSLDIILNTHWHGDHTGGNKALKAKWGCRIITPAGERTGIPGSDQTMEEGETVELGSLRAKVIETPGHTAGHIVYYFADIAAAFVGDTLFSLGCGRLFEGSAEQMWHSLQKLRALPDDTEIFCAHEYSKANADYALSVDPENQALIKRAREITELRAKHKPTIPSSLGLEKKTNPFLRADSDDMVAKFGLQGSTPAQVFAHLRQGKDNF
jgi:hydroxyacylglutathione hydrolase